LDSAPARELLRLGRSFQDRGSLEEARALFDAAAVTARALGDRRSEGEARSEHGRSLFFFCEPLHARRIFEEARDAFADAGDREQTLLAELRIAFWTYDAGDTERAGALLDAIGRSLETLPERDQLAGLLAGYRGNVARARGDYGTAARHYETAIDTLERAGDRRYAATFRMDTGILALASNEPEKALDDFARSRRVAEEAPDPALGVLLDHYGVLAAAALGERALVHRAADRFAGPPSPALEFLARTHRLALGDGRALAELESECPPFEHGRLSMLVLRRALGVSARSRRFVFSEARRTVHTGGAELDLARREPLFRIVRALVAAGARSERTVAAGDLIEAAWPGERIDPRAAKNRLHVAIATLRRMGLGDSIERDARGYRLSHALSIVREL
jgi:tetratricopeptide (TPR) repeat protein